MRSRSRIEQQRVEACRDAARFLRAHGLDTSPDAVLLERQLVALDRSQLAHAQQLQLQAQREKSLPLVDLADAALVVAQQARDLRARLLELVALKPTNVCPCGAVCPLPKPGKGRAPVYCSEDCRKACRIERRGDVLRARRQAVRFVPHRCAVCEREFLPPARGSVPTTCAEHRGRRLPTPALPEVA